MTSANHNTPPRQPDENEPLDHADRDVLDFIDETAARITDTEVDEHLGKVLDQAGYRQSLDRHAYGTEVARPTGDPRPADTRRRSVSRFLLALAGAVPEIADRVPGERVKLESLGGTMLITSGMAAVSMWFALASVLGVNGILATPVALLWGLVIIGTDRWLITSMPGGGTRRKLAVAAPRILLTVLLGTLISAPLMLQIFQPEINTEIGVTKEQQYSKFLTDAQHSQVGQRITYWQLRVSNLRNIINSHGHAPVDPSTDPLVQSLTAQRNHEVKLAQKYYQEFQCQLYGGSGCPKGNGPLAQATRNSYEQATTQVTNLNNQIQAREAELTSTSTSAAKNRYQQAQDMLPGAEEQLHDAQMQMNELQESFTQRTAGDGLLIRLEALGRLADKDSATAAACLVLLLLFLAIECLPVVVKLLQQPGAYDMILARERDKRMKITLIQEGLLRQNLAASQEEHAPSVPRPQDAKPAQSSSETEPLTVSDSLRREIESIYPFMRDTGETTAPGYHKELENCFMAISEAVNELLRHGYDSDQITEALRVTADMATQQLAAAWQAALEKAPSS